MRNFKKFLAFVMATLMILSAAVITTGAATSRADYTDAAQHLVALRVMKGDEKGNLMLDKGVSRYQAALFFAQTLTGETKVEVWNAEKTSVVFKDVTEYGTAVDYVYGAKVVAGRGNGVFGPNDPITYQDMLVMAVRALGYETEGMSYPYGYILAAQKLGLTDNVKNVNYKAALTRGETAQIIWDTLNTVVAIEDPLSGKILYPDETGLTAFIAGKEIERKTLLLDSGYASGTIEGVITAYNEADSRNDIDTVIIETEDATLTVAASDLGITAKTRKVGYLGLPVKLLVDVAAEDFENKYDTNADKSEASVVYAEFETYTTVENLGAAGNIKYSEADKVLTLNGTKYSEKNYEYKVYTFSKNGWVEEADASLITDNFAYTSKDGYNADEANSYGKIAYRIIEDGAEKVVGGKIVTVDLIEILYTPYEFGQYFNRTIKYSANAKKTSFVTIGEYKTVAQKNLDDEESHFVEYFVGAKTKTAVTSAISSVSKNQGEKAATVAVEGETVKSGDFVFYDYNEVDNVLTVAYSGGTFKEGRLTGTNKANKTVKIDGSNKTIGFKGAFTVANLGNSYGDYNIESDYISKLSAGKNNVKYVVMDDRVVYMEPASGTTNTDSVFDYVIATLDSKVVAKALGISETKYNDSLTSGLYINDDGYVAIAVLNTATGKFEAASLRNFCYGNFDEDDESFSVSKDVASLARFKDLIGTTYKDSEIYDTIVSALKNRTLFLQIEEKNGVYDLAGSMPAVGSAAAVKVYDYLVYGDEKSGLTFSDSSAKTNKITADPDTDPARVSLDKNTVIVVIDGNTVSVRKGVQKASNSISVSGTAKILSANSSLIVMDVTGCTLTDYKGKALDVKKWGNAASASTSTSETYYVALADYSVDVETNDDDKYVLTINGLFDLKTLKTAKAVKVEVDTYNDAKDVNTAKPGQVLYMNENGEMSLSDKTPAEAASILVNDDDNEMFTIDETVDYEDAESITIVGDRHTLSKADLAIIKIRVITLDVSGVDAKDYDYDRAIVADAVVTDGKYDGVSVMEDFAGGDRYYFYTLADDEDIEIAAPTFGTFDNFVAAMNGKTVLIQGADADYGDYDSLAEFEKNGDYEKVSVELGAYGVYEKGSLNLTVVKLVTSVTD